MSNYEVIRKKYDFSEYVYINDMKPIKIEGEQKGTISSDFVNAFIKRFKHSLKMKLSESAKLQEQEKDQKWLLIDEKNQQRYLIEKDEKQLHVFNVVAKVACTTCGKKFYTETSRCDFCHSATLREPQERFPELDSKESFPCPSCEKIVSVDVVYDEENKCQCGKKIEICNNCQGLGYVRSEYAKNLSKKEYDLLNPKFYTQAQRKTILFSLIPVALFILLWLIRSMATFSVGYFILAGLILLIIAPAAIYKIMKPVAPNRSRLISACLQCAKNPDQRGIGIA